MSVEWVWAGAGTATSVWVRGKVTGASTRLAVSETEDLSSPVFYGPDTPTAEGVVSIEATGLEADTRYYYALEDDSVLDTDFAGTFRTHPTLGEQASFTVGAAGDAGLTGAGDDSYITDAVSDNPVFDTMRQRALSEDWLQFIHLGDLHYRNLTTSDPDDYRDAYHDTLTFNDTLGADARQGHFFRSLPLAYVWDDHDYSSNNSDGTYANKDIAAEVYREIVPHYPLPAGSGAAPIYQSWQIGRILFLANDVRYHRDPNTGLDDGAKTMLGAEQKAWMERVLRNSDAQALVWVMPSIWLSDQAGGDSSSDSWGRFRAEREQLVELFGDTGWLHRMVCLQADKHALSISSGPANPWGGFPVFMFASMDSHFSSTPELQYDLGQSPGRQRYGTLQVVDSGHTIALHATGYVNDTVWRSYTGYAHVEPHILALDYSAGEVFEPFEPTDDDQHLANDVTAERRDGGEHRADDTTSPLRVEAVGRYSTSHTVNVRSDDELGDQAGWLLHQGTVDEARYPTITHKLHNPRMQPLRPDVARQDMGDAITISNPPAWLPPEQIGVIVEGYEEEITTSAWEITYNASPATIWQVGVVAPRLVLTPNHDFEAGVQGWEAVGSTLTHSSGAALRGQYSGLQTPDGVSVVARSRTTLADSPRVYAGAQYTFTVGVLSATGGAVDMSVEWFDHDDTSISFPFILPATTLTAEVWTLITASAVAPEGAHRLRWNINQRPTPASSDLLWIDEAVISDGSSPHPDRPNRLDTAGSALVEAVDDDDTELLVATTHTSQRGTRWITSNGPGATHAHEFPLDLRLGGEVVRATGCEGAGWDLFRSSRPADTWGVSESGHDWDDTAEPDTSIGTSATNQYAFLQLTADTSTIRVQTLDVGFEVGDCEIVWSVRTNQTSSGSAQLPSLILRHAAAGSYYRCRLHLNTDSSVSLSVTRTTTQVGDSVTPTPAISYTPSAGVDDRLMVRTRLIGHRVLARVWPVGQLEPHHWMIDREIEDDTIETGKVGFSASTSGSYTGSDPSMRFQLVEMVTPQRMTVTRAVNTVTASHDAGAAVSLAHPALLGL